ncbi:MAG: hypothetical protein RLZZ450_4870 [Pseudomonadota bacterium]|jgi:hypothetical protein
MPEQGEQVRPPSPPEVPPPGNSKDEKTPEKKKIKVRVSLFFDGTANSRENADVRLLAITGKDVRGESSPQRVKSAKELFAENKKETSFTNDHSNVSRLQMFLDEDCAGYDYYLSIYAEGIGTTDLKEDSVYVGQAFGAGATGIKAKVDQGITRAIAKLREKIRRRDKIIEKLTVDTFGFSRGAAGARYCIHRALNDASALLPRRRWAGLKTALERMGFVVEQIEIRAVGLFDTVSSYGFDHADNTPALKLDAITKAKAVLQLAASEEYRTNFSLTNIDSAGGKGRHVYLPGAHSDIGGGYPDNDKEDKKLISAAPQSLRDLADFLRERGWYVGAQLQDHHGAVSEYEMVEDSLSAKRSSISKQYSFIPLRIMADFAMKEEIPVLSKLKQLFDPVQLDSGLVGRIEKYAKEASASHPRDWEDGAAAKDPALRTLRNRFLHVSYDAGIGMGVRTIRTGPYRTVRPFRLVHPG